MPIRALMRPQEPSEGGDALHAFSCRHFLEFVEDTGKVGFWSADLRAEYLDASPGLSRILGLDPDSDLTFGSAFDMIHPDDKPAHSDQLAALRNGQPINREFRVIRPDRTQRWVRHHAEVIIGQDGRPNQGMGVVFDVTAHHEATNAMLQRHDRLNALISATAAVLWTTKANGEPSDMVQWMSLTGQSFDAMQGLGWMNAIHPEDRPRTHAAWITAVEHTAIYNTDYRLLCADGIYRWFNARGAPVLNKDGSVREWVGVCLNVPGRSRYGASGAEASLPSPRSSQAASDFAEAGLTPGQVRAARGLLGLSKDELAKLAHVSVSTLNRLEDPSSAIQPRHDTVMAVRRAFEKAGVEFTFEAGRKPGVREA